MVLPTPLERAPRPLCDFAGRNEPWLKAGGPPRARHVQVEEHASRGHEARGGRERDAGNGRELRSGRAGRCARRRNDRRRARGSCRDSPRGRAPEHCRRPDAPHLGKRHFGSLVTCHDANVLVEASAAAALAAIRDRPDLAVDGPVVLVMTGRNFDPDSGSGCSTSLRSGDHRNGAPRKHRETHGKQDHLKRPEEGDALEQPEGDHQHTRCLPGPAETKSRSDVLLRTSNLCPALHRWFPYAALVERTRVWPPSSISATR